MRQLYRTLNTGASLTVALKNSIETCLKGKIYNYTNIYIYIYICIYLVIAEAVTLMYDPGVVFGGKKGGGIFIYLFDLQFL